MLNTGVVVAGEVVISVADIDLVYLNLQAPAGVRRDGLAASDASPAEAAIDARSEP